MVPSGGGGDPSFLHCTSACYREDWGLKACNIPAVHTPGADDARQKAARETSGIRCAPAMANGARWGLRETLRIRCALAMASDARASAARAQGRRG